MTSVLDRIELRKCAHCGQQMNRTNQQTPMEDTKTTCQTCDQPVHLRCVGTCSGKLLNF